MIYDFDSVVDRKNTNSLKWDCVDTIFGEKDILPMWVADMDFCVPGPVVEAMRKRAEHGAYGYTVRPASYHQAIINWMKRRHGWEIKREWLCHSPGVVPALNLSVLAYTQPGDKVIVQSPVYYPFFSSVKNNGRQIVINELKFEDGRYTMDFEGMQKLIDSRVKLMIISNPHNPVGRVWSSEELSKLGEMCIKNNIILVSDEIHSDLIFKGSKHVPAASLSEELAQNTVTCIAPSKTFNIAGLATSVVIIPNPRLKALFCNQLDNIGIGMGNTFGIEALEAAYNHGEEWLEQLLEYLQGNLDYLMEYFKERIPKIKVIKPEGTYLIWLDCKELGLDDKELKEFMIKKAKIGFDSGTVFGAGGEGFQRMNMACSRSTLDEGLRRLERAVNELNF